jgi:hypothetical protein
VKTGWKRRNIALQLLASSTAEIKGQYDLDKCAATQNVSAVIRHSGAQYADIVGLPEIVIPSYLGWIEMLPYTLNTRACLMDFG